MFAVWAACNGADGISDMEGKVTRVGASEWSRRAARDIDGKTDRSNGREHMSQCGQRASFNRPASGTDANFFIRSFNDPLANTFGVLAAMSSRSCAPAKG